MPVFDHLVPNYGKDFSLVEESVDLSLPSSESTSLVNYGYESFELSTNFPNDISVPDKSTTLGMGLRLEVPLLVNVDGEQTSLSEVNPCISSPGREILSQTNCSSWNKEYPVPDGSAISQSLISTVQHFTTLRKNRRKHQQRLKKAKEIQKS